MLGFFCLLLLRTSWLNFTPIGHVRTKRHHGQYYSEARNRALHAVQCCGVNTSCIERTIKSVSIRLVAYVLFCTVVEMYGMLSLRGIYFGVGGSFVFGPCGNFNFVKNAK